MIMLSPLRYWYRSAGPAAGHYSHMVSDYSISELHDFAAKVGLKRHWFKGDHYELDARQRQRAAELGAETVEATELLERMVGRLKPEERERLLAGGISR